MNERFARAAAMARVDLAHEPDFVLGRIEVRPARRELAGAGRRETLEPLVMRVLVALARARGEIVSRDDLIESCWDGVIVGEDAINRSISRLRKAAEAAGGAFSVETVPRVGYRLRASEFALATPVGKAGTTLPPDSNGISTPLAATSARALGTRRPIWVAAVATLVLLAFAAAGAGLWFSRQGPAEGPVDASVAVLPFTNMSGDPAKEYFSDGFSEELLNDLSNNPHLRVAARSSAFAFKGRNEDVETIAHALRVHAVVEGSVRESGNRVRITAQLIDAGNGYNIWSATYDRNLADILSVQEELARAISAALTHKLVPATTPTLRKIDPTVYREYLEAMQIYSSFREEKFTRALSLLSHVTSAQPDFADGYAALATLNIRAADYDSVHNDSYIAHATVAVQKALSLDPQNVAARVERTMLELTAEQWSAATADYRMLLREHPDNIRVLRGLHVYYDTMGFGDKSIATMRRVRLLDPLSDGPILLSFDALQTANHYNELIELAHAFLIHHPDHPWAESALCIGYAWTGHLAEARQAGERLHHLDQGDWRCDFTIAIATKDPAGARKILEKQVAGFPDKIDYARDIAEAYVQLGDFDRASDWYERSYDSREFDLFSDAYRIDFAKYHATPRWKVLMQRPRFKEWQVEHDKVAAELAANGGSL